MSGWDRFREWDAAYVMGALAPAERREYEQHLSLCQDCAAAVSAVAGLSGPLAALSREEAFALLDEPAPVMPSLLPGLLERAEQRRRQDRRRARWRTAAVAAAAAVVAAVVSLAVPWDDLDDPGLTAMQKVAESPISADARLVGGPWGTRIEGVCRYAGEGGPGKSYEYLMYVTDTYGKTRQIGSWTAGPGSAYAFAETTSLPRDHIAKVEIRGVYGGEEVPVLTLP